MSIHAQNMRNLLTVYGTSASKLNNFCEKLLQNVQSLKMLGKLKEVNAWLYIPTNDRRQIRRGERRSGACEPMTKSEPGISPCGSVKKLTERYPVIFSEKSKEKLKGFNHKGLKSGLILRSKGLKYVQQQDLNPKFRRNMCLSRWKITGRSRDKFRIDLFQA